MKISPSNIGTASQAFNAKSAFPYVWAWDMSAAAGSDLGNAATNAIDAPATGAALTATQAPNGIIFAHGSNSPYYDLRDQIEYDTGSRAVSGQLNGVDTAIGRYLHFVLTRNGTASNGSTALSRGGTTGTATNQRADLSATMYWYPAENPSAYNVTEVQEYFRASRGATETSTTKSPELGHMMANGVEILCFDMFNSIGNYPPGGGSDHTWQENTDPLILEPYFFDTSHADSRPTYELHGIVLSTTPLTDIPLPIRTHMG